MINLLYFCYGDKATGVIRSQAIDVVRLLAASGCSARLCVAVPFREGRATRSSFRQLAPDCALITAVPTRLQRVLMPAEVTRIARVMSSCQADAVICRNAFAADLALRARKLLRRDISVCLDGRGALAAEQAEYGVHPAYDAAAVERVEQRAVVRSDARIAVTEQLVHYWRDRFGYRENRHVVIPTTLSEQWTSTAPEQATRDRLRAKLGIRDDDVLFLYAGSNSPWQGIDMLLEQAETGLRACARTRFLFLAEGTPRMDRLSAESGGRFRQMSVQPREVRNWMQAADYGLLLRPHTTTNEVAFPTKYAEYLSAGLMVISNGPPSVLAHMAGAGSGLRFEKVIPWDQLKPQDAGGRQRCFDVAARDFSKSSFRTQYEHLLRLLAERPSDRGSHRIR